MHISTLNGADRRDSTRETLASGQEPSVVHAMLRQQIASLQVSSQNATASESQSTSAEMSVEMATYTRDQVPGTAAGAEEVFRLLQ